MIKKILVGITMILMAKSVNSSEITQERSNIYETSRIQEIENINTVINVPEENIIIEFHTSTINSELNIILLIDKNKENTESDILICYLQQEIRRIREEPHHEMLFNINRKRIIPNKEAGKRAL